MRLRNIILAAIATVAVCSCDPRTPDRPAPKPPTPVEPEDPDPITMITTPGAYGVEGGTVIFDFSTHQLSILEYEEGFSYRLFNPEEVTVHSISGIPGEFKAGETVSFLYRVQKAGRSIVSVRYEMEVMQVKDGKAWLKKDDETFFVIVL